MILEMIKSSFNWVRSLIVWVVEQLLFPSNMRRNFTVIKRTLDLATTVAKFTPNTWDDDKAKMLSSAAQEIMKKVDPVVYKEVAETLSANQGMFKGLSIKPPKINFEADTRDGVKGKIKWEF